MTEPILAHCNTGCKKEFKITKFRKRKVKYGIEKNYFRCPHCKHEYVTYYASAETIQLQKEMRKLHVSMRGTDGTPYGEQLIREEKILKARIKKSMDEAKAKVES